MKRVTSIRALKRPSMAPPTAAALALTAREFFESSNAAPKRTHPGKNYWECESARLGRNVALYGDLRYDHWVLVESNPQIIWYAERPTTFRLRTTRFGAREASRIVNCQFDMVIEWRDHTIECRRILERALSPSDQDREWIIDAERRWCAMRGYRYVLLSKKDIAQHERLIANWKTMLPRLSEAQKSYNEDVLRFVAEVGECTLDQLADVFSTIERSAVRIIAYRLLHSGHLVSPNLSRLHVLFEPVTLRVNHE